MAFAKQLRRVVTAGTAEPGLVFAALADPTRRSVVQLLAGGEELTATQLASRFPMTRQAVAKHLGALAEAGIVEAHRDGRELRYRFRPAPFEGAMQWMATVGGQWDRRLATLKERLTEPDPNLSRRARPTRPRRPGP